MKKLREKLIIALLILSAALVTLPVLGIMVLVIVKGYGAISLAFLTEAPRAGMRQGGIFPAIIGTLYLTLLTLAIALPLGALAAVYLNEYSKRGRTYRLIKLAIINMAGIPSVVYGLFGLGLFVIIFNLGSSVLAGALTLAILILPIIITASEEALATVPVYLREASYALGATKWQTVWRVVLPRAMPGILTSSIIGVGRAAGETAPILFTVAAFFLPRLPSSLFDQAMALPYHLYVISTQVPGIPQSVQYGTALVLIVLVLGMNMGAILLRARLRKSGRF